MDDEIRNIDFKSYKNGWPIIENAISNTKTSVNRLRKISFSLIFFTILAVWLSPEISGLFKPGKNDLVFYLASFNILFISIATSFVFFNIYKLKRHLKASEKAEFVSQKTSYRRIIENSSEAFFIIKQIHEANKESFFIFENNSSGLIFLNKANESIIGREISELFPESVSVDLIKKLHKSSIDKNNQEFEFEYVCSDFSSRGWYRCSIMPQPDRIALILRDITDRKKAEATLKESEAMFRALAETSVSLIFIIRGGYLIYANPAFQAVTGYEKKDFLNIDFTSILHPDQALNKDILKGIDAPFRDIIKIISKDGSEKWVDVSLAPINFDSSPAILGTALDITKRKIAEEELKESEVRFRTIFDSFPYAISLTEVESGKFINVNNQFCKLTKYSSDQIIGRTSDDLGIYSKQFRDAFFVSKLKEVGFVNNLETDFRASDGSLFNGSLFSRIIRIRNNDLVISVIKDITILKNLQRQLQQTQKMEAIGTLAGGIAHDFNNILVPIIAYTEMSMTHFDETDKLYHYLKNILKASNRAKDLVQQILSFSRHNEMTFEPILIQPVIKETVKFLRASIPATIEIKTLINNECGAIIGNPSQIHQIIMNLATNAKHAMEATGGVLEIRLEEKEIWPNDFNDMLDIYPGKYARLTISDTGHGIEQFLIDKIFEPYFTTKKDGKGTGIGLSVVHGIVKTYGGTIKVKSRTGKGTRFEIYLPLVHRVSVHEEEHCLCQESRGMEHVLVVDDEQIVVNAEKEMLERLGYRVTALTKSIDALDFFRMNHENIDIVITDMTMPKMTGAEFAMKILEIKPGIPIILCTGYSENFTEANANAIGIKKYIAKPFIMNRLAVSVREALSS